MIARALSRLLARACVALLPPDRAEWARAMGSEAEHIDDDGAALRFAAGCVFASLSACFSTAPVSARLGRIAVALVTLAYAVFHLKAALNGAGMLAGASDPHYERLLRRGVETARQYKDIQPYTVAMMAGIGLTHLTAAIFLVAWVPRLFAGSLLAAAAMVALFVASTVAVFGAAVWPVQLLPLLLLGLAGFGLSQLRAGNSGPGR